MFERYASKMGLAGLRAFTTVDSGMPTVTAARPFRWGWRCLGEQRDKLCSNLRTFFAVDGKSLVFAGFADQMAWKPDAAIFRNAKVSGVQRMADG
jgi:hypothetical protein